MRKAGSASGACQNSRGLPLSSGWSKAGRGQALSSSCDCSMSTLLPALSPSWPCCCLATCPLSGLRLRLRPSLRFPSLVIWRRLFWLMVLRLENSLVAIPSFLYAIDFGGHLGPHSSRKKRPSPWLPWGPSPSFHEGHRSAMPPPPFFFFFPMANFELLSSPRGYDSYASCRHTVRHTTC